MAVVTCFVLCLVWLLPNVQGYFVSVDAHAHECFFDRVDLGMKMGLTFEVVEGGFLDIDVQVRPINAHQPILVAIFIVTYLYGHVDYRTR